MQNKHVLFCSGFDAFYKPEIITAKQKSVILSGFDAFEKPEIIHK